MIRFHSKAGADVLMLSAHAQAVLRALGKAPTDQGIFEPDQVEEALLCFERALQAAASAPTPEPDDDAQDASDTPDLARRAWPLLALLRRAAAAQHAVIWSSN